MRGKMLRHIADFSRGRPNGIDDQDLLNQFFPGKLRLQYLAGNIIADKTDKDTSGSERGDIARDVSGAADIGFASLDRKHRSWRFRRNARHLAIDEFIKHQIADTQHGLTDDCARERVKIEHLNFRILLPD